MPEGLLEIVPVPRSGPGDGEGVGVDGEVGGDREVGGDVGVGAGGGEDAVRPVDEVVAGVGNGCDQGAVSTVVDGLGRGAFDRPAAPAV